MRKIMLTGAAALLIGGIATGAALSQAQPAPPPGGPSERVAPHDGGPQGRMMGWRHGFGHEHGFNPRDFALIYHHPDRALAPADVQKIVEGFLLWNGNHDWKVMDVAATPEGPIAFSLATQNGSAVAKFTMDPHTGRLVRIG